jgi:hypothetical protein
MTTKDISIEAPIVQCSQTKRAAAEVETGHTRIIMKVDHLGINIETKVIEAEFQMKGRIINLIIVKTNICRRMKKINTEEKINSNKTKTIIAMIKLISDIKI